MSLKYSFGRSFWRNMDDGNEREWLIGNGLGGFANHTILGGGNKVYHGYLIASTQYPVDRYLVFTRTQEQITVDGVTHDLTSQTYVNWKKEGHQYLSSFTFDALPTYHYQINDISIKKTVSLEWEKNTAVVCYEVQNGISPAKLDVIPLFNFRRPSDTSLANTLIFDKKITGNVLSLVPQANKDITISFMSSAGTYYDRANIPTSMATPNYVIEENHYYAFENRNGFLGLDSHYTPYQVEVELASYEHKKFYVKCSIDALDNRDGFEIAQEYKSRAYALAHKSIVSSDFAQKLSMGADHFIVKRASTGLKTILAGFPWFADWGRDTMIALQGLTLCTGRFEDTREILESFSRYVKNGLIPNVFPDKDQEPYYNTVDGSMWYFYSVDRYLTYTGNEEDYAFIKQKIYPKLKEIYHAYKNGTDFSIKMDTDGLICAGGGLDQVTWMDVRVGDWVVTPRHGKPVEIQALWYNALCVMANLAEKFGEDPSEYQTLATLVKKSFNERFWNEDTKCLYDVVDEDDAKIRPNQIWSVFLPNTMLSKEKEKSVVDMVYKHLYTPYGLRSLSDTDPAYQTQYLGKLIHRDAAYHMGTVWAFPIGGFISAYCKVHNHSAMATQTALEMCECFHDHMHDGCINGISEIFDGEFACTSRGCYTQAWSVGEVLRAYVEDVYPYLNK